MSKKSSISLSVIAKMKEKTQELKKTQDVVEVSYDLGDYESKVDYKSLEIVGDVKDKLLDCEKRAVFHGREVIKNSIELSKIFYEAQQTLASHKSGVFVKWFESIGFKKTFVYTLLKKNEFYLNVKDERVFDLSKRVIENLSKHKDKVNRENLEKIIASDKPQEVMEQIIFSPAGENISNVKEITVEKIMENDISLERKLKSVRRQIKALKSELKDLKETEEKLLKEIEEKNINVLDIE